MASRTVKLIDEARNVLALAHVEDEGPHYGGTVDLRDAPASFRALCEHFDEAVNDQIFGLADEIEEQFASLHIKAVFEDGSEGYVTDLQVFPSTGGVSFKLAEPASS
jgi:hypothetical protein